MLRNSIYLRYKMYTRLYSNQVAISPIDYCANIVRQHDYENFLATLLLAKEIRSAALVVRAFNVEIAKIQDQTTDSKTAEFRLQFWKDTLKHIYKKDQLLRSIPAHPIAQELYKINLKFSLGKRHLEKLVTSRHLLLKNKHFQSLDDLEKYSDESVSSIYFLVLGIADINNVHADHVASHLGKAQGLTNVLRSIHISNQYKMVSLPMDVLMNNQVSQESVLRGVNSENMRNVVFEIASRANSHIEKARSILAPKSSRQIFLPAIAVDSYLKKLQQNNFNVFDKSLHQASPWLPVLLYYNKFTNKY